MTVDDSLLWWVVALNLAAGVAHGVSHGVASVSLPLWGYAVVGLTVGMLPLVGLALRSTGRLRTGTAVVALAGLAALAFEGLAHFVVPNPDHVGAVADGAALFAGTAALTTVGDVLLVVTAGWLLVHSRHGRVISVSDSST